MFKLKRKLFFAAGAAMAVILLAITPLVGAADTKTSKTDTNSTSKAPVTQSYGTDGVLQNGMIVRLNAKYSSKVEPLRQD